jgi:hypothetical protein
MASFYRATVAEFLSQTEEHVLARLSIAYANRGFTSQYSDQTLTWERDISSLRSSLQQCVNELSSAEAWGVLLEFSIHRKELRIDAVLLVCDVIVVLEAKTGDAASQAKRKLEIQGLELDWIGLCWGGDFVWNESKGWQLRALRHGQQSKWTAIKSADKQIDRRNAYRVLLTRARQGMIIFVPKGDANDPTNLPADFDATAQYLVRCGVTDM